jgi:hypothetical protein
MDDTVVLTYVRGVTEHVEEVVRGICGGNGGGLAGVVVVVPPMVLSRIIAVHGSE